MKNKKINKEEVEMKLKTLKDMKRKGYTEQGRKSREIVLVNKLKQEAIKDFKNKEVMNMTAQEYIFVKFNITDKDLK